MIGASDDGFRTHQHEVQRLYGQCLLHLQKYELLTKALLAEHKMSEAVSSIDEARSARTADVDRKTLGTLVSQLIGSFIVVEGNQDGLLASDDEPLFAFQMQVALPVNDFVRTENDLREFVALRNDLVHHFLEQHDLSSVAGCDGALDVLSAASARISQAYGGLRAWAEDMTQMSQRVAEVFASSAIQDFVVEGRIPWPITGIVQALREAEADLGEDGWTPVAAAGRWISERYLDELPEGYGCRSWRQVIHESGLFELRYRRTNGLREAWYRGKGHDPDLP